MTMSIVVVDDNEVDRYLVKRLARKVNVDARVSEFEDGLPFVDVIRDKARVAKEIGTPPPPILVLLDINMPRMNGFEVLEVIKEEIQDDEEFLFVTMYSSSDHAQDRADAEKYPFVKGYLLKPATTEDLESLLDRLYPS